MRILNPLSLIAVPWPASMQLARRPIQSPSRIRSGRRAVVAFAAVFLIANVVFSVGMDRQFKSVRDPEYGRRAARWHERRKENPNREMVAILGSSRTAMGIRPDLANGDTGPLLFNFGHVGSGPVMQAMVLRRLLHDGVKPDAIYLEYWPAFMREDGPHGEEIRIDPHRLFPNDAGFIDDYFDNHVFFHKTMDRIRWNPFFEHRQRIVSLIVPSWLPIVKRLDSAWEKMDRWGWLPGYEKDLTSEERVARHKVVNGYFSQLFATFYIHEKAKRATRELILTCREHKIPVTFLWLPESTIFRGDYPPHVLKQGEDYLNEVCREFDVPLIDMRDWIPDVHLGDGFHLTQPGAAVFSRKFGEYLRGGR